MRRPNIIEKDMTSVLMLRNLTNVFESLASTQVAKVKNKAQLSQEFFNLLWERYTAIRIDQKSRITARGENGNGRTALILISAEAGLSGDLDLRLIETMQRNYDPTNTDIICLAVTVLHNLVAAALRTSAFSRYPKRIPMLRLIQSSKQLLIIQKLSCTTKNTCRSVNRKYAC